MVVSSPLSLYVPAALREFVFSFYILVLFASFLSMLIVQAKAVLC